MGPLCEGLLCGPIKEQENPVLSEENFIHTLSLALLLRQSPYFKSCNTEGSNLCKICLTLDVVLLFYILVGTYP